MPVLIIFINNFNTEHRYMNNPNSAFAGMLLTALFNLLRKVWRYIVK